MSAAANNPLLYALEAFLVRLLMQFQLAGSIKKGAQFWCERARAFNEDRRKLLDAVRDGDVDRAVTAWDTYLSDQYQLFASDLNWPRSGCRIQARRDAVVGLAGDPASRRAA